MKTSPRMALGHVGRALLVASLGWSCSEGTNERSSDTDSGADEDAALVRADASPEGDGGEAPVSETPPFDWVGIVGTGQSLSIGSNAAAVVSKVQPYKNGMLVDTGPNPKYPLDGGSPEFAIAPLVEPVRGRMTGAGPGYADRQYPNNITGETPNSGMANEISALFLARTGGDYVSLHSLVGWSGRALSFIEKADGFRPYAASLMEAKVFRDLAAREQKTFGYGAVVLTHGEADWRNETYGAGLKKLLDDYNTDLKAITGQTRDVVLLASQQSVRIQLRGSATELWRAGVEHPGRIVCTGPKYQYAYAPDALHMPAPSYRRLGEKYGEVFDLVVNRGQAWKPLQPTRAVRNGRSIVVTFDVPNPPLEWDETLLPPHQTRNTAWANGRGFEVTDADGQVPIASVAISSPTEVTITLGATPAGDVGVAYALIQDGEDNNGGRPDGFRGQLRDSDALVGYDEADLSLVLTKGSTAATLAAGKTLETHTARDVVTGEGAPPNFTIMAVSADQTRLRMSAPWPGESGTFALKVHHDLHNYAVHAYLPVP